MYKLHIDLESRSRCDLLAEGAYKYASDPSTDILCMCYAFDDQPVRLWTPDQPFPFEVAEHIIEGQALYAHHAAFERNMFDYILCNDYNAPVARLEQWHCTAFMARCNNIPAALVNTARALKLPHQKHLRGRDLIRMLCSPQADGEFYSSPELLEEMYGYCEADVEAERAACNVLRQPEPEEWQDYFVSERINDRGVRVDFELAVGCQAYAQEEEQELTTKITEITGGEITKARGEKLKAWVIERLNEYQQQIAVRYRKGKRKYTLDKYTRAMLLIDEHLDPDVRAVIECSDFAQRSSVSKFKTMQVQADPDDRRVRGAFIANGASQSGRYSARGLQVHNFPRKSMEDPDEVRLDLIENIEPQDIRDYFDMPIMEILSGMLRPALIPEDGHSFLVSDWAAIEGRVAPWLSDNLLGEDKLNLYREGVDTYVIAAESIYPGREIDEKLRQVGKVAELALQFGGGSGAFLGMGRNYGVSMSRDEAEMIKTKWRRVNPWAPKLWDDCQRAAHSAIQHLGVKYSAGRLSYFAVGGILCGGVTLFCQLPCGRLLTYPDTREEKLMAPGGRLTPGLTALRAAWTPKAGVKEWPRAALWGGLLVENATQGTAASLLRRKLREVDAEGLSAVLHIHDEIILEVENEKVGANSKVFEAIMNSVPGWAVGLPIYADVKIMKRFGK